MSAFATAVLLAWIAGFVDAVGYVVLAHVFTAHVSGNTVASAVALAGGSWPEIARKFFPIPTFVVGVFVGSLMGHSMQSKGIRWQFAPSFILEVILLALFVEFTINFKSSATISGLKSYPLVALLALAMGLQNATLRRVRGMAVRTTFITGMLVNTAERAAGYAILTVRRHKARHRGQRLQAQAESQRRREKKRALKYGLLWCGMFIGGAAGVWLERIWGTRALLFPAAALIGIIIKDFFRPLAEQQKA